MTERYVKLFRSIWDDPDYRALSVEAQWLYQALISQPDISAAGVVPMVERRWARLASNASLETVGSALSELGDASYVVSDNETGEVWIRSYIRHDGLWRSPNGRKAIERSIGGVLSTTLRDLCVNAAKNEGVKLQKASVPGVAQGATEGVTPGATEGADEQAQQAGTGTGTAAAAQSHADGASENKNAAAADQIIDCIIGIRLQRERNIRNPASWRATLKRDLPAEHADRIQELLRNYPSAPVSAIAGSIVDGSTQQLAPYAAV